MPQSIASRPAPFRQHGVMCPSRLDATRHAIMSLGRGKCSMAKELRRHAYAGRILQCHRGRGRIAKQMRVDRLAESGARPPYDRVVDALMAQRLPRVAKPK